VTGSGTGLAGARRAPHRPHRRRSGAV